MFNWNVTDTAINYLYKKPVKMFNGEISHPFASYIGDFTDKNEFYKCLHDLENDISCCDTEQILLMMDRNYILEFLEDIHTYLTIEEYSKIVMNEYSDANTGQYDMDYIIRLFVGTDVFCMMDEKESEIFNALPECVTVYRGFGVYDCSDTEFLYRPSWTLKKEIADLFSIRAERDTGKIGAVYQGTISKSCILAFTNCRKEFEVIINPCYLKDIKKL